MPHGDFQNLLRYKAQFSSLHSLLQTVLLPEAPSPFIGSLVMSDIKVCGAMFPYT